MQAIVLATMFAVVFAQYAAEKFAPSLVKLTPEVFSILTAAYIVLVGTRTRFENVHPKYWIIFVAVVMDFICGIVINHVDAGPIVAGMRLYARAIPFFLLPALCNFSERQIRQQLWLLLLLALIQTPFALKERWSLMAEGRFTGDLVFGTLGLQNSGTLSLFLIAVVCILLGFLLRGKISKSKAIMLFFVLLIPTTINETKITVFLLPLSLFATLLIGSAPGRRLQIALGGAVLLVVFGSIFIPIYNYTQENNPYPQKISLALLTDNHANYLEAKHAGVGATQFVGRGDAISIPLHYVGKNPVLSAFGLGMGNATISSLGQRFSGQYGALFEFVEITSFPTFVLELGLFGLLLIVVLHWFVFIDTLRVVRKDRGIIGVIAVGFVGVNVVAGVAIIYQPVHLSITLTYLFWYFAGLMAAQNMRLSRASAYQPLSDQIVRTTVQPQFAGASSESELHPFGHLLPRH